VKHLGRKLYHVGGGIGLLGVWFALGRPRAFYAYAALLAAVLLFDGARLALPRFNAWAMANLCALLRPVVPNAIEADASSASSSVHERSSRKRFTHGVPVRAVAFQSIARTSSPGAYGRDSSNSTPPPRTALRQAPTSTPAASRRLRTARMRAARAISARAGVVATSIPRAVARAAASRASRREAT
jgi:hypothetical protein